MEWTLALVAVAGIGTATPLVRRRARSRRTDRLRTAEVFRLNRALADQDVTCFGEELMDLHVETMTTDLDPAMRANYQQALDSYDAAKASLAAAAAPEDVTGVVRSLADGRFHLASVLARRDDAPLPERREPCFFDPGHGPASRDVTWTPPGGVEREIPVCFRDAERLAAGEAPQPRLVRLGDRRVAWYAAGPAYSPWATGWYDRLVRDGRYEADRLTMMFSPGFVAGGYLAGTTGAWSDPGGWTPSDLGVGYEYGGGGGSSFEGGGFDGGGFDGGGGDGGGGGGGGGGD